MAPDDVSRRRSLRAKYLPTIRAAMLAHARRSDNSELRLSYQLPAINYLAGKLRTRSFLPG